jgi:hypothetical protein
VGVDRGQRPRDKSFDEPFARSEMMQHRGMRDACFRSDFLEPDPRRPREDEVTFGSIENRRPRSGGVAAASRLAAFFETAAPPIAGRLVR